MIIDAHTHTFPDKIAAATIAKLQQLSGTRPFSDGTCAGLSASMRSSGVDMSVVLPVATSPRQVVHINDAAAQINRDTGRTGLLSLGGMHPDFEDWKSELRRVRELGLRGIKLHPAYQGVDLDDVRFLRILDEASALGLVAVTHAGWDIGLPEHNRCTPDMVLTVLREVGPDRLVLAHMGGWRTWDEVADKLAGTPVWLDTAFSLGRIHPLPGRVMDDTVLDPERFVRLVRRHGAQRVLFGTDSPWGEQTGALDDIRALPLTREERALILGQNAARLFGLDLPSGNV